MSADMEEDPRSVPATIGPLEQDLELPERDRDAAQAVTLAYGMRRSPTHTTATRPLGKGSRPSPFT